MWNRLTARLLGSVWWFRPSDPRSIVPVLSLLLVSATCLLAYSNGANDNFKGVASLFGSETTDYRTALAWGTLSTFLGSVASVILAQGLLSAFSGKGLVPPSVAVVAGSRP